MEVGPIKISKHYGVEPFFSVGLVSMLQIRADSLSKTVLSFGFLGKLPMSFPAGQRILGQVKGSEAPGQHWKL